MKAAIGQDSHRFEETPGKPLILGGVVFPGEVGLLATATVMWCCMPSPMPFPVLPVGIYWAGWPMRCAKAASPIQRNTCGKP